MAKVLVVAVHPDDETLGCGGTLLRHRAEGDEIFWMICTSAYQEHGFSSEFIAKRKLEISNVAAAYGFKKTFELGFATTKVDEHSFSQLIGKIEKVFSEVLPEILYLPYKNDAHSDHRKMFSATMSCAKSFRCPSLKRVYMMETLSETEFADGVGNDVFSPNVFVDVTKYFDKKIEVMKNYGSELGQHPFPRSEKNLRALALTRGATSGFELAESFMLVKEKR